MVLLDEGGAACRGECTIIPPPADLRHLVEHVVVQTHPGGAREWRIVPDVSPHVIVHVIAGPSGHRVRAALVGARSTVALVHVANRVRTVGLRLRPGALRALASVPTAADLTDRAAPLDDASHPAVRRGLDLAADMPPALLVEELLRMMRRAAAFRRAPLAAALEQASRVDDLAAVLTTPERSLRDLAVREIGLAPKLALRIQRLHRALHLALRRTHTLSDVACAAGYADQAHLTREHRSLLGETPTAWLERGVADSFKTASRAVR